MSEPWPPAFIRTAPPIEPGTPTAHSKPVSPALTLARATRGRKAAAPAVTAVPVDVDPGERVAQQHGHAGEPGVGHQQVGPLPHHQHVDAGGGDGRGHPGQVLGVAGLHEQRGRPPDPVGRQGRQGYRRPGQAVEGGRRRLDALGRRRSRARGHPRSSSIAWMRGGSAVRSPAPSVRHRSPGRRVARSHSSTSSSCGR